MFVTPPRIFLKQQYYAENCPALDFVMAFLREKGIAC